MRNLLRCRRGSVAFATVVALVPLIGVVALGAEAGSWYVTKQHAQNAADAAAYSGALAVACSLGAASCSDAQSMTYRAKEFAAQNGFCNAGDTTAYPGGQCATSLPSGTSQTVQIASLASWNGVNGNFVQATVSQQQPAHLATVLGLTTVDIGATAVAQVVKLANPCILSLHDPLSFQGSPTVQSPNCGLASNSTATNSISFTGNNGINVSNVGSMSAQGGCSQTGGTECSQVITFSPPVPNPLSGLDTAIASLTPTDFPDGACPPPSTTSPISLPPYGVPKKCYYDGFSFQNNKTYNLNGVYFFADGPITIQGNTKITGTATLILLPPGFVKTSDPGASLKITGTPTIQLTAETSVSTTQVPAKLASAVNLLSDLLIYDPETTAKGVNITGNAASFFNGITYVPNSDVTFQGSTQTFNCVEVIAKGVTLSGNTNLDNSGCPASSTPTSQYVRMVQ